MWLVRLFLGTWLLVGFYAYCKIPLPTKRGAS